MFKINIMMKNNKHFKKKIVLLIIVILYLMSLTVILGKYAVKGVQNVIATSKGFYFESDILTAKGAQYTVTWDGKSEYIIPIYLYTKDKENEFAKAKDNIQYTINVDSSVYELTFDVEDNIAAFNKTTKTGIIYGEQNESTETWKNKVEVFLIINPIPDCDEDFNITITATTKGTYSKTLSAKYSFVKPTTATGPIRIVDQENRDYCTLIVNNTEDSDKIYTVSFPTGILIDSTNPIVNNTTSSDTDNNNYIDKIQFSVSAGSSINIKFYKTNKSNTYTVSGADGFYSIKGGSS